ncbi:hypothetical protein [Streptococcus parasuis]|uniref:hypothetical protein n=1 Tax=Streptococcus parasuis TaxID=1501662 RepID=UPI00289939F2|nr:hypothetical protein [Streptococcus parasuis]
MSNFENRLHDFHKGLIAGNIYSRLPYKNDEALAMISLYRHGAPWAKLEAKRWLQKVMEDL